MVATRVLAFASTSLGAVRSTTGERINLFDGDRELPSGTPFCVRHGVAAVQHEDQAIGRGTLVLEIDGVRQPATCTEHNVADGLIYRIWIFNRPDGMAGTHTFTGRWLAACGVAALDLPCGDGGRQELVDVETQQITVTFTE